MHYSDDSWIAPSSHCCCKANILNWFIQLNIWVLIWTVNYRGLNIIKELCTKVSKLSGLFHHIDSFINADMVRQLYYASVFPHINYGIELCGSACKTNIAKVQVVQIILLKTLAKHSSRANATSLYLALIFVYRQRRNQLPGLFHQF